MNNLLHLKGRLYKRKNTQSFGSSNLPKEGKVSAEHINELKKQLEQIRIFWEEHTEINGALVSVHYQRVVPKSNRIQILLGETGKHPNDSICGAKFVDELVNDRMRKTHVFTYFISLDALDRSIGYLGNCEGVIREFYNGEISGKETEAINQGSYDNSIIKKSPFLKTVIDSYYVDRFQIDQNVKEARDSSIITIYKTGVDTVKLLSGFGIDMINAKMISETTLRLEKNEIELLQNQAPYLIAMQVSDFSKITLDDFESQETKEAISIPSPKNEPVVGVIDTQFDERVYFHEWVEYHRKIDDNIDLSSEDYFHGTAVSSIIVDGPRFNPKLEDGCGRFRVRHFGVAKAGGFSSFTVLKQIRDIVASNRDIKVWNLSLGSAMEIDPNFISPEAAELDRIQCEYDVLFIVAGTNKSPRSDSIKIGAPADSLNSLVVNAVDFSEKPASYTRVGPVLSFFYKPDICYYGGDKSERITVCEPLGEANVCGTSFAAPWITRKVAYLMHIVGLSRELTKALIIDSAAGWNRRDCLNYSMGYGVVPKNIQNILHSPDDEIRFVMNGIIDEYETYTYNLPVPRDMNAFPFFAKATLVYFPKCDRDQGVDYTSTEMDLHFGRVMERNGKATIKSIDLNKQDEEEGLGIVEESARKLYRKWDNVKHISEAIKDNARPRKAYDSGMWGISIKTKERLSPKAGRGLQFGLVVTLKEMNGVNRIDEFIKLCMLKGWVVSSINVQNQIDIHSKFEEEIEFD